MGNKWKQKEEVYIERSLSSFIFQFFFFSFLCSFFFLKLCRSIFFPQLITIFSHLDLSQEHSNRPQKPCFVNHGAGCLFRALTFFLHFFGFITFSARFDYDVSLLGLDLIQVWVMLCGCSQWVFTFPLVCSLNYKMLRTYSMFGTQERKRKKMKRKWKGKEKEKGKKEKKKCLVWDGIE